MSDLEKFVVIELRTPLLLALNDLLVIVRTFINPSLSRSGLDRCLRCHGVLKAIRLDFGEASDCISPVATALSIGYRIDDLLAIGHKMRLPPGSRRR